MSILQYMFHPQCALLQRRPHFPPHGTKTMPVYVGVGRAKRVVACSGWPGMSATEMTLELTGAAEVAAMPFCWEAGVDITSASALCEYLLYIQQDDNARHSFI